MGRTANVLSSKNPKIQIPKSLKDVGQKVAEEAINAYVEQREEIENDENDEGMGSTETSFTSATDEQIKEEVQIREKEDIFDIGEKYARNGVLLTYTIRQNNAIWRTMKHPYTWSKLQIDGGPGHYRVTAKNPNTNTYVGQQSEEITSAPEDTAKNSRQEIEKQGSSLMDSFITLQEQREERLREDARRREETQEKQLQLIKEEAKEKNSQFEKMLLAMINPAKAGESEELKLMREENKLQQAKTQEMMMAILTGKNENKGDDTNKMLMEMQRMNMEMMKELRQESMQLAKETKEETHKLIEKFLGGKKEEFGALDVMKLVSDAKRDTKEEMKDFFELVEEKSRDKAEQMTGRSGNDEDEPETTSGTLLKALIPALGNIVSQGLQQRPAQLEAPLQPQMQQPRRPVRPLQSERRPISNGTPSNQNQTTVETSRVESSTSGQTSRPNGTKNHLAGLPSVGNDDEEEKALAVIRIKKHLLELITPIVLESLLASEHESVCATKTINLLIKNKFPPKIVKEIFTAQEIIDYAATHNISDEQYKGVGQWLENYFHAITQTA